MSPATVALKLLRTGKKPRGGEPGGRVGGRPGGPQAGRPPPRSPQSRVGTPLPDLVVPAPRRDPPQGAVAPLDPVAVEPFRILREGPHPLLDDPVPPPRVVRKHDPLGRVAHEPEGEGRSRHVAEPHRPLGGGAPRGAPS